MTSHRGIFYYGWFPETWGSGSIYTPSVGAGYGTTKGIVQTHIAEMEYAKCKFGVLSWWGSASPYDPKLATCFQAAEGTNFKWCPYFEQEAYSNPSVEQLRSELDYVMTKYVPHPNYYHRKRKPVIFVYEDASDGFAMADRWKQANAGRFYLVLKVFKDFRFAQSQPDCWHEYAPANAFDNFAPFSYTVSPGFVKPGEPVRLARDPERFKNDVIGMSNSQSDFHLITTFNEFGEGTCVEPTLEFGLEYLDILAKH